MLSLYSSLGCKITITDIRQILWDMFPESVRLLWENTTTISVHYFARQDNETFCCVEGTWWRIVHHEAQYLVSEEEGYDWYPHVDSITEVAPPTDVIYSHTLVHEWDYNEPVSARPYDVTSYMGYDRGYDLMLRS